MPATLELLDRGPITLESAAREEFNLVHRLSFGPAKEKLYQDLWEQRDCIAALTKHHLGLGKQDNCVVLPPHNWIRGSFNVCVFVEVKSIGSPTNTKFVFRCPMPHKLAESRYPGTIDEKLGCEVGAYVWVQEKCPEIRTPHLFGFGFSDGRHFTHAKHRPLFTRITRLFWRSIYSFFRLPVLSHYVHNPVSHRLHSAYMLLEYLGPETGQMLSQSFDKFRRDGPRSQRLFRDISRIILSLARVPQARIGSFQFNDNGTITLTNRALCCSMMILENDGATRTMQKNDTFSCTDAFVSEVLRFHDNRFLSQPNAVYDEGDCRGQMAIKTLLRALSHNYIQRQLRNGPFVLQLTDFHASNIFVDEQWNITALIDLEWICALPSEMLAVPYWLTGCSIDEIKDERFDEYDEVRREFMSIFKEEEQRIKAKKEDENTLSKGMQDSWDSKGVWFWNSLSSVNAMYIILERHFCASGSLSLEAERAISEFWCRNSEDVVRRKIADKQRYDEELGLLFAD